jgi:Cupin domain
MPGMSKETAPIVEDFGPVANHQGDYLDYSIQFLNFRAEMDGAPMLRGLPNDMCISAHWGYVIKGGLTFHFADHSETYHAGDAFYVPPGHTPANADDTEYVQFSPTADIKVVSEVIKGNLAAMQAAER